MKRISEFINEKLKVSVDPSNIDAIELFDEFIDNCKKKTDSNSEWVCYLPSIKEYKKIGHHNYDNLPKVKLDKQYFVKPESLQSEEGYLIEIVIYFGDNGPRIFLKYLKDDYKTDNNFRIHTARLNDAEHLIDVIGINVIEIINKNVNP